MAQRPSDLVGLWNDLIDKFQHPTIKGKTNVLPIIKSNRERRTEREAAQGAYEPGYPTADLGTQIKEGLEPETGWNYGSVLPIKSRGEPGTSDYQVRPALPLAARDAGRGVVDLLNQDATPEAMRAMTLPLAGDLGVGGAAEGALRTFGGPRGAYNLYKAGNGDPIAAHRQAQILASAGLSPEDIYKSTGWFRGTDGKWRFEIDDSKARIGGSGVRENTIDPNMVSVSSPTNLSNVLDHLDLYAAYPELRDYGARPSTPSEAANARGGFNRAAQTINLAGATPERMTSTALHEGQHAIQDIEGFAGGAGGLEYLPKNYGAAYKSYADNKAALDGLAMTAGIDPARIRDAMLADYHSQQGGLRVPPIHDSTLEQLHKSGLYDLYTQLFKQGSQLTDVMGQATDRYARTAGEVEARNVQTRMDMGPEQRAASYPPSTEDVAPGMQLVQRPPPLTLEPVDFDPFAPAGGQP